MSFATHTAVHRVDGRSFAGTLHERWSAHAGVHGGYSAAVVLRAIHAAVDDPARAIRNFAVLFTSVPRPGAVEVEVTIERAGRSVTTTSARMVQDGRLLQVAHAVSALPRPGMVYDEYVRPQDADPGDTPIFQPPDGIADFQNAEVRLDPQVVPCGEGTEAWIGAWLRPLAGEAIDAEWLVTIADMLPPAVYSRTAGWVQAASIEYVVHFATAEPHLPAGEHVYLSCRAPLSSDGFAVEDATIWGPDGSVLAVARQTRLAGG